MTTKQELIHSINAIVSEYLGFTTEESNLKKFNKAQLAKRLAHYEQMIELKRGYEAIKGKYSKNHWLSICMFDWEHPDFIEASKLYKEAQALWLSPPIR